MERFAVSVIIPSYNSAETILACLSSLETQDSSERFEVIVVDSSTDGSEALIVQNFPAVTLCHLDERLYPGAARNYGVACSSGDILAFIDADCYVEATWVQQIFEAHQITQHPVVGGAIANGNPKSYVGWGYYFSGFSQWMPQVRSFERVDIPAGCLSCKRWAFEQYGPFIDGRFCEDTLFTWTLANAGYHALFDPRIQVFHHNLESLIDIIKRKIKHGKMFAQVRVLKQDFSVAKQLAYALSSLLLPVLMTYRRSRDVFDAGIYRRQYVVTFPVTLIGIICWSIGEFLGYAHIEARR